MSESLTWCLKVSKVTSTKHKNILLRVAHGDIYTKEKLNRFGMVDDPSCPRCGEIETLRHKFLECDYVKRIWKVALEHCRAVTTIDPTTVDQTEAVLGSYLEASTSIITLNAEILQRINSMRDEDYLIHPKFFVKSALGLVIRREKNGQCKEQLKSISGSMANT